MFTVEEIGLRTRRRKCLFELVMIIYGRLAGSQLPALVRCSNLAFPGRRFASLQSSTSRPIDAAAAQDNGSSEQSQGTPHSKESRKRMNTSYDTLRAQITTLNEGIEGQLAAGASCGDLVQEFFGAVSPLQTSAPRGLVISLVKDTINSLIEKAIAEANDPQQQRIPPSAESILNKAIYQNIAGVSNFTRVAFELLKDGEHAAVMNLWVTFLESQSNLQNGNNTQQKKIDPSRFKDIVTLAYLESCVASKSQPEHEKLLRLLQVEKLPRVHSLRTTVFAIAPKNGKRSSALNNALDAFVLYDRDPNSQSNIISTLELAERGDSRAVSKAWETALKISKLNGKRLSESTLIEFMKIFNTIGNARESQNIWNTLLKSGITPSTDAWNVLLVTVSKIGPFQSRLGQVEFVKGKISAPNAQTTATLIKLYTQFKKFQKVEELAQGNLNTSVIGQAYLQSVATRGDFAKVEEVMNTLKGNGVHLDIQSYNKVLSSALEQRNYERFAELLTELRSSGVALDVATYSIWMDYNLKILANRGEVPTDYAFELFFRELEESGIKPNVFTFTAIMDNLSKVGSIETSQYLFRYLQSRKMASTVSYISLITSEFDAGLVNDAEAHFQEFLAEGHTVTSAHWAALFKGFARNGRSDKCREYLVSLNAKPALVNRFSLYFLLSAARNKRDAELADQVFTFITAHKKFDSITTRTGVVIQELAQQGVEVPEVIATRL